MNSFSLGLVNLFREMRGAVTPLPRVGQVRRRPLHANSVYLIINFGVTAMLGLAFWAMVARLYTPKEVGLGSALRSAVALLSFLCSLGLGYGLIPARRTVHG